MRVRTLTNFRNWLAGDEDDIPDAEAEVLIKADIMEPVYLADEDFGPLPDENPPDSTVGEAAATLPPGASLDPPAPSSPPAA